MFALGPPLLLLSAIALGGVDDTGETGDVDGPQAADEGAPIAPQRAPQSASHEARLDAAVALYLEGDARGARGALLMLVTDPTLEDQALLLDARLWLGEIQFSLGDYQAAEKTFETVLLSQPGLRLDPFRHPPDVVNFFESVRAAMPQAPVGPPQPVVPPPRPPPTALTIATPGGLQFYNGQVGLGVAAVGTIGGLSVSALSMRLWLIAQDDDRSTWGIQLESLDPDTDPRDAQLTRVKIVENTMGFTALGLWGAAVLQGAIRASLEGPQPAAALGVTQNGAGLVVRF